MSKLKILASLMVAVMMILGITSIVYAQDIFQEKYDPARVGEYIGYVCRPDGAGGVTLSDDVQKIYDNYKNGGTKTITVKTKDGSTLPITVTEEGYNRLVELGKQIYDKESIRYKVHEMSNNFNVEADTKGAGVMLSGIRPVVNLVIGVLAYGVVIGMSLFTALDLCYITMPIFRNKCEEMKQSGAGLMVKTTKTGEVKLRWVTDEAQYAVQHCAIETGQNPYLVYFKKRVMAFILIAIVIYILLTGNIQLIVNIAINVVSGILDALSSLGSK